MAPSVSCIECPIRSRETAELKLPICRFKPRHKTPRRDETCPPLLCRYKSERGPQLLDTMSEISDPALLNDPRRSFCLRLDLHVDEAISSIAAMDPQRIEYLCSSLYAIIIVLDHKVVLNPPIAIITVSSFKGDQATILKPQDLCDLSRYRQSVARIAGVRDLLTQFAREPDQRTTSNETT